MILADSHCHLDFDAVMARGRATGVRVRQHARILATAAAHDDVFRAVGAHPRHADDETDISAGGLIADARHPKAVGLG